MAKMLSISEARIQINALSDNPEEVTVTKRGEPVLAILPYEVYESLLETLEVVVDEAAMQALRQDLEGLHANQKPKTRLVEAVAEEMGLELPG